MAEQRLGPKAIARRLFDVDPDRDERASQLCMETLLTITENGYEPPGEMLGAGPKVRRFALRSLIFERNFFDSFDDSPDSRGGRLTQYGRFLADGTDFAGADNLPLAKVALKNLVDPSTEQGQAGCHLMLPFHESMLWYDARPVAGKFFVRKVRMRGSGITFARMLLAPPAAAGAETTRLARLAVDGLRNSLTQDSPLAQIASLLEGVVQTDAPERQRIEDDEQESWKLGGESKLAQFASALCRHAEGIVCQGGASGPARLWQFRTVLALDLAMNSLRRAWNVVGAPSGSQCLLLGMAGPERQLDKVRLRSERSYEDARTTIRWATVRTIASVMEELYSEPGVDWSSEFEGRTAKLLQPSVIAALQKGESKPDFRTLAQLAFENANYERSGEGFRVLLESIGLSAGGTRYRYLSATPDLLAALVGALSAEMPMTSSTFFRRLAEEWSLVISPEAAVNSAFGAELDGSDLAANTRRFEKTLIEAGLASGLSDRTVLVGERTGRRTR